MPRSTHNLLTAVLMLPVPPIKSTFNCLALSVIQVRRCLYLAPGKAVFCKIVAAFMDACEDIVLVGIIIGIYLIFPLWDVWIMGLASVHGALPRASICVPFGDWIGFTSRAKEMEKSLNRQSSPAK